MSQDPFAPPRADLDVPEEDRGPPPRRVKIATGLAAGAFALALLTNVAVFLGTLKIVGRQALDSPQLAGTAAVFAIYGVVAWKIYLGRNWARVVLVLITIFAAFSLGSSLAFATTMPNAYPQVFWVVSGAKVLIAIVASVMLFTGESKAWFSS